MGLLRGSLHIVEIEKIENMTEFSSLNNLIQTRHVDTVNKKSKHNQNNTFQDA